MAMVNTNSRAVQFERMLAYRALTALRNPQRVYFVSR
jgi:hypothetical protein